MKIFEDLTATLDTDGRREEEGSNSGLYYAKSLSSSGFPAMTVPRARLIYIFAVTCALVG